MWKEIHFPNGQLWYLYNVKFQGCKWFAKIAPWRSFAFCRFASWVVFWKDKEGWCWRMSTNKQTNQHSRRHTWPPSPPTKRSKLLRLLPLFWEPLVAVRWGEVAQVGLKSVGRFRNYSPERWTNVDPEKGPFKKWNESIFQPSSFSGY